MKNIGNIVLLAVFALAGCSVDVSDGIEPDQVVARVNAEEISIHQVNNVRAGRPDGSAGTKYAARSALDRLVDRELLVQQAEKHRIDRNPEVIKALESAQKDILARAYLEHVMAQLAKPDAAQIREFYTANPALFSQRKIYTLREFGLTFPTGVDTDQYIAELKSLLSADDGSPLTTQLAHWAQMRNVAIKARDGVKASEELPVDVLAQFSLMKRDDTGYLRKENGVVVFHVVAVLDAPIAEVNAQRMIENILVTTRRTDLLVAEMKRLRGDAYIEYRGEFADSVAAVETVQGAPLQSEVKKIQ